MIPLTQHAAVRCAQRGIRTEFLDELVSLSDVDTPIGSNCRLFRVSRKSRNRLDNGDKLRRYAVIWSDDSQSVVTVLPLKGGRAGRRYRSTGRRGGQ
jgi:hypothetical protein